MPAMPAMPRTFTARRSSRRLLGGLASLVSSLLASGCSHTDHGGSPTANVADSTQRSSVERERSHVPTPEPSEETATIAGEKSELATSGRSPDATKAAARRDAAASRASRPDPFAAIEDDPALPRVLLIGDSISIGYTLGTRSLLASVANVHRPPTNCGPTTRGVAAIDDWLGAGPWDLIHFNFGLHDLKYVDENGKNAAPATGTQQVPIDAYVENLSKILERLEATGATLIFATTTPVPEGEPQRVADDSLEYNRAARALLEPRGVRINDLHALVRASDASIQRAANVHFTPEGSQVLASRVASEIRAALAAR